MRRLVWALVIVAAIIYMANPGFRRGSTEASHLVSVTDATFAGAVDQASGYVVVDFWAPWCGPCRRLMPVLDEAAATYARHIPFVKVNIDENPRLVGRFHIESIPQVYLFKDGRVVDHFLGHRNAAEFRLWLNQHMDTKS
jgi:thioredoxin 1